MFIEDFFSIIEYKIASGNPYLWKCFGSNVRSVEHMDESIGPYRYSINAVFDTKTKVIYELETYDYDDDISYRWINPEYKDAYYKEASDRDVDADIAYGNVEFTDVDLFCWEEYTKEVLKKYER
nr:MAG: hypothetical protein [Caudoviricetes sp.]